jgi:hypothetical protein
MDMLIYPYNDMFAHHQHDSVHDNKQQQIFYLKLNNKRISYSRYPYWKKDFAEQQIHYYSKYLQAGHKNHIDFYIDNKFKKNQLNQLLHHQLSPLDCNKEKWTKWYLQFTHTSFKRGDTAELVNYSMKLNPSGAEIIDSSTLFRFTIDE